MYSSKRDICQHEKLQTYLNHIAFVETPVMTHQLIGAPQPGIYEHTCPSCGKVQVFTVGHGATMTCDFFPKVSRMGGQPPPDKWTCFIGKG
jgi:hypothetical protein